MSIRKLLLVCVFTIAFSVAANGQPVCPTSFPSQSPVPSNSPDDIPPTNIDIVTFGGTVVKARANHNIAFVEITPNDQRVWFGVDGSPGLYRTFYNRRVRDNESSPWRWLYSYSPAVVTYSTAASQVIGAVLYSATPRYHDDVSNRYYKFVMYEAFQPSSCDGVVAALLYYSFSDDGICWTPHKAAVRTDGPSLPCVAGDGWVPIEQVTAIDAGGDKIWLVGMEGDVSDHDPNDGIPPDLLLPATMRETRTTLGWAHPFSPGYIYVSPPAQLSADGLFLPRTGPVQPSDPDRYRPYAYFVNLQMAYDQASGDLYIGRGYPYPFDRGETGPYYYPDDSNTPMNSTLYPTSIYGPNGYSTVQGCANGIATFPNRVQIYKMHIGALSNINQITTGTWTLVTDVGGPLGYGFNYWPGGPAVQSPLVANQLNAGRDYGTISFLRDGAGRLMRYGTTGYFFGGDSFMLSKGGSAQCRITGTERNTVLALP